ncbi:MAG: biopolymer transporter ExbD [Hassallia sp.]
MKVNLHSPVEEVQIQIIPLIDVIFCILTFFILAALQFTRQQAINVDLPKASTGTGSTMVQKSQILPVTIDALGQTYVEKQAVKRQELAEILRNYVKQNPNGVLVLNASRTATYNDVIETLDLLRQVGGDRVSLGIIPGSASVPTSSPPVISPFPVNPGAAPIPNTTPVVPINPQSNPNFNLPPNAPIQPLPGQGLNPTPSGVSPIFPPVPVPEAPAKQPKAAPAKR